MGSHGVDIEKSWWRVWSGGRAECSIISRREWASTSIWDVIEEWNWCQCQNTSWRGLSKSWGEGLSNIQHRRFRIRKEGTTGPNHLISAERSLHEIIWYWMVRNKTENQQSAEFGHWTVHPQSPKCRGTNNQSHQRPPQPREGTHQSVNSRFQQIDHQVGGWRGGTNGIRKIGNCYSGCWELIRKKQNNEWWYTRRRTWIQQKR